MALPKRRTPKAKQQHRRSHHHLTVPHLVQCTECNAWHVSHHVCEACEDDDIDAGEGDGAEPDEE